MSSQQQQHVQKKLQGPARIDRKHCHVPTGQYGLAAAMLLEEYKHRPDTVPALHDAF